MHLFSFFSCLLFLLISNFLYVQVYILISRRLLVIPLLSSLLLLFFWRKHIFDNFKFAFYLLVVFFVIYFPFSLVFLLVLTVYFLYDRINISISHRIFFQFFSMFSCTLFFLLTPYFISF